jgi:hypothetical protein
MVVNKFSIKIFVEIGDKTNHIHQIVIVVCATYDFTISFDTTSAHKNSEINLKLLPNNLVR